MFTHGNEETTIGVKYFSAYVCIASEIELTEIMQRIEFQFLAFKSSHNQSLIATAWMHFGVALPPSSCETRRCRQTPFRRASGTSRSLNRQWKYHGGKFRYRSWTSGMLAARRFADRTPPFGILSAFVIACRFFVHHLTVRLLPRYTCQRAPKISHGVYSSVPYFHTRL